MYRQYNILRPFLRRTFSTSGFRKERAKAEALIAAEPALSTTYDEANALMANIEELRRNNSVTVSNTDISTLDREDPRWKGPIKQFARSSPIDHLIPQVLTDRIDDILREEKYIVKQDHIYREKRHPLWFVANEMPIKYTITHRVLLELYKRVPEFRPTAMLDYGSTSGGSLWAAQDIYSDSLESYLAIEPSLQLSRYSQEMAYDLGINSKYSPKLRVKDEQISTVPLTVAAYSIGDIPRHKRTQIFDDLWKVTKDFLVLIERGDPQGSDAIRIAREYYLKTYSEENLGSILYNVHGASVIAPCTHNYACPMGTKESSKTKGIPLFHTFCRFAQKINRGRLPAKSPLRQIKVKQRHRLGDCIVDYFSYIILRKGSTIGAFDILGADQHPRKLRTNERMKSKRVYVKEHKDKQRIVEQLDALHQLKLNDPKTIIQQQISKEEVQSWQKLLHSDTLQSLERGFTNTDEENNIDTDKDTSNKTTTTSTIVNNDNNSLIIDNENENSYLTKPEIDALAIDLIDFRPHELRELCTEYNLFDQGNKDELQARIWTYFAGYPTGDLAIGLQAINNAKEQIIMIEEEEQKAHKKRIQEEMEEMKNMELQAIEEDSDDDFDWGENSLNRFDQRNFESSSDRGFIGQEEPIRAKHLPSHRSTVAPAPLRSKLKKDDKVIFQRWARILGPPLKKGQHVVLDTCTPDGALERRFIGKSQNTRGGYWLGRKLRWGDLIYYTPATKGITYKFKHGKKAGSIIHLPKYPVLEGHHNNLKKLNERKEEVLELRSSFVKGARVD